MSEYLYTGKVKGAFVATKGITGAFFNVGGVQSLSGAGAADLLTGLTKCTSTGAGEVVTLADGTEGQIKTIIHVVDGGSVVVTPATRLGYASITLDAVGDSVTLMFVTTLGWVILASHSATVA